MSASEIIARLDEEHSHILIRRLDEVARLELRAWSERFEVKALIGEAAGVDGLLISNDDLLEIYKGVKKSLSIPTAG